MPTIIRITSYNVCYTKLLRIDGLAEVFLKMVDFIMKGAPYFVLALMAGIVSEMAGDNPQKIIELFKGLSWYFLTVVLGLVLMAFVFYPIVMSLFAKKKISYKEFMKGISPAQMLAFSTSSSRITSYNVCYTKLLRLLK